MKKTYIIPAMAEVKVAITQQLLAGSEFQISSQEAKTTTSGEDTYFDTLSRESGSFWDDED